MITAKTAHIVALMNQHFPVVTTTLYTSRADNSNVPQCVYLAAAAAGARSFERAAGTREVVTGFRCLLKHARFAGIGRFQVEANRRETNSVRAKMSSRPIHSVDWHAPDV